MSLPRGWTRVALGDVADIRLGKMLDKARTTGAPHLYLRNVNVRWDAVDTTDLLTMPFKEEELERYEIRPGDLLVCEGGEPGRSAIWTHCRTDLKYQKALHRVRLAQGVAGRWVMFSLMRDALTGQLSRRFTGSTIAHLPREKLLAYEVTLPPAAEQERIIEALDSYLSRLDVAVTSLESAQQRLKAYRASVLKAAVEGRLVPTEAELALKEGRSYEPANVLLERILKERRSGWEEAERTRMKAAGKTPKDDKWKQKYEEGSSPDPRELPELPAGWCWATMPQVGELTRGKSKHRPRNHPRLLGGKYPFVQTGDIRRADTWLREFTATYSECGLAQSKLWPSGTLCITIAANIAETAILAFEACFPDSVVGFVAEDPIFVRYVEMFLRTARQELNRYAPATAQKNINLDTLSNVAVPLPPLQEQRRIVEELDRLLSIASAVEETTARERRRLSVLRHSILKSAFQGLLVDQDSDDEPGDALLARIRAERVAATAAPKAKRARKLKAAS